MLPIADSERKVIFPASAGIFPLRLGRKRASRPLSELIGTVPVDEDDRIVLIAGDRYPLLRLGVVVKPPVIGIGAFNKECGLCCG